MQFLHTGLRGFQFPFQGAMFLRQHRTLWKWALFPALINFFMFAVAIVIFVWIFPSLYDLVTAFIPVMSPETWYAWLWIAPLRLLAWLIGALLVIVSLAVLFLTFLLLGTVVASPFLDMLAQGVEDIVAGQSTAPPMTIGNTLRSFSTSVAAELKRLSFFIGIELTLFLLGLIPLLSPITVLTATLFTILFLPLQYAGYAMDHRLMTFTQRRNLIWQQRWLMLGFGASAFLTLLIPLLNFVCLPILVVSGTLLMQNIPMRNAECGMRNDGKSRKRPED